MASKCVLVCEDECLSIASFNHTAYTFVKEKKMLSIAALLCARLTSRLHRCSTCLSVGWSPGVPSELLFAWCASTTATPQQLHHCASSPVSLVRIRQERTYTGVRCLLQQFKTLLSQCHWQSGERLNLLQVASGKELLKSLQQSRGVADVQALVDREGFSAEHACEALNQLAHWCGQCASGGASSGLYNKRSPR